MELNRYGGRLCYGRLCFVRIASICMVFLHMVLIEILPVAARILSCYSALVHEGGPED